MAKKKSNKQKPQEPDDLGLSLPTLDLGQDMGVALEDLDLDDDEDEDEDEEDSILDELVVYTGDLEADLKTELLIAARYSGEELEEEKTQSEVWVFENTAQKLSFLKAIGLKHNIDIDPLAFFIDGCALADALGVRVSDKGLTKNGWAEALAHKDDGDELPALDLGDPLGDLVLSKEELNFIDEFESVFAEEANKEAKVEHTAEQKASMQAMLNQYASGYWDDYHDGSFYFIAFFDSEEDRNKCRKLLGIEEDQFNTVNGYAFAKRKNIPIEESSYRDKDLKLSSETVRLAFNLDAEVFNKTMQDA